MQFRREKTDKAERPAGRQTCRCVKSSMAVIQTSVASTVMTDLKPLNTTVYVNTSAPCRERVADRRDAVAVTVYRETSGTDNVSRRITILFSVSTAMLFCCFTKAQSRLPFEVSDVFSHGISASE